jgi:hypothetical protein
LANAVEDARGDKTRGISATIGEAKQLVGVDRYVALIALQ